MNGITSEGAVTVKIFNSDDYPEYKTSRQWAKQGFLPIESAKGTELWANRYCQDKYIYFSPDEVEAATAEQLSEFFRPERERRNAKAKIRRQRKKAERQAEIEHERRQEQQEIINNAVKPYLARIFELQKIIKAISAANAPSHSESKTLVIDTETTGLDTEKDELLQVSIIDSDGNALFNSYFKPCVKSWADAQRVNGISPEMVQNAPTISEKIAEINEIMYRADKIIGYNTYFDINFLSNNGLILSENVEIVDVMELFAPIYGEWSDYYGSYKWQKLTTAAEYCGYDWNSRPEGAHNSLADCYATYHVYRTIQKQSLLPRADAGSDELTAFNG